MGVNEGCDDVLAIGSGVGGLTNDALAARDTHDVVVVECQIWPGRAASDARAAASASAGASPCTLPRADRHKGSVGRVPPRRAHPSVRALSYGAAPAGLCVCGNTVVPARGPLT